MAKTASKRVRDIFAFGGEAEPLLHGGDLAAARRLFPAAPQPFIDLSTGINPFPYRLPRLAADLFALLPDPAAAAILSEVAAKAYGAPSPAYVVLAPGTQILLGLIARLAPPGRAAILTPTYGEFARAAALAGHEAAEVGELTAIGDARLAFVANPNNPDGRLYPADDLIVLAERLQARSGLLVVDEAFMDVGPRGGSLAPRLGGDNIVVLRSFGKFFGLAGIRLGFALTAPPIAARLSAMLGPWAVSGPALAIGTKALADAAWTEKARNRLVKAAARLDAALSGSGLAIIGGTTLFRLVHSELAAGWHDHLGRAGILVRSFPEHSHWLRFGLPANEQAWRRLTVALAAFGRRR